MRGRRAGPSCRRRRAGRRILGALLGLVAVNAVGGGAYGLTGAESIPRRWLEGSPFTSYVVPSLVLLIVVGGTQLVAAVVVARGAPVGRRASLAAAAILAGWIAVQVAVIGYVSWLQPAMAIASLLEGTLAWWLAPAEGGEGR